MTKAVCEKAATAGYKESQQANVPTKTTISWKCLLNPNKCLSNGWHYRFINRHRHLVLRKEDPTANVRMDSVNKETMNNYFTMLKDTLTTKEEAAKKKKQLKRRQKQLGKRTK